MTTLFSRKEVSQEKGICLFKSCLSLVVALWDEGWIPGRVDLLFPRPSFRTIWPTTLD